MTACKRLLSNVSLLTAVVAATILLCLVGISSAHCQTSDADLIYLGLDTLDFDAVKKVERDGFSFHLEYPADISADTIHYELFLRGKLIAIVPNYLRRTISEEHVKQTAFIVEPLPDGQVLLRIIKIIYSER
jgi:hypothetical protein